MITVKQVAKFPKLSKDIYMKDLSVGQFFVFKTFGSLRLKTENHYLRVGTDGKFVVDKSIMSNEPVCLVTDVTIEWSSNND